MQSLMVPFELVIVNFLHPRLLLVLDSFLIHSSVKELIIDISDLFLEVFGFFTDNFVIFFGVDLVVIPSFDSSLEEQLEGYDNNSCLW